MTNPVSPKQALQRRKRGAALLQQDGPGALARSDFAVLGSFNLDLFPPLLLEAAERIGVWGRVYPGAFGQMAQEILNPASALYADTPDSVVLVPAVEDVLAPLFARPADFADGGVALAQEQAAQLEQLVSTLLERLPRATVYLVAFGSERAPAEHILSPRAPERGQAAVEHWLAAVRDLATLSPRVVVADWDWHTRGMDAAALRDERLWYLGRMRLGPAGLATLADLVARHVAAYRGTARKVAAVDLDNTLWGGVIGEAGLGGIALGNEGVGLAFQDFQRELLKLHDAGVVLVAASKNNPEDALEVFDRHPGMILRREHFAALRINWQDKATNLRELATELNVGIDSFVFLDDNPVEREWIRQALPEVLIPDLPADPVEYPAFVRGLGCFGRIGVTEADLHRAASYKAQGRRSELASAATSFGDFLASLEQEITVEPVSESTLARAAQMCQRTNQFNLTTRRYTSADLEEMLRDPQVEVHTLAVRDKFGDSGITGLAILRLNGEDAELDTLLLSCRVLGRQVEDAFLHALAERARERGARSLTGRYLPTQKNRQVASFYPDRGFREVAEGEFRLVLNEASLSSPNHVSLRTLTSQA